MSRESEVWRQLATVNDPELDESVTELRFVTAVAVDDAGAVDVSFRLPTYWCAANFAFLMAEDMRLAVASLPWVTDVSVTLGEHMYAETINTGIAAKRSFQTAFGDAADGDLETVRRTFLVKAFQRRQVALVEHLLAAGLSAETLAAMSIADLHALDADAGRQALVARYLDRRAVVGPAGPAAPAFVDEGGQAVPADAFRTHIRALRRVAVTVEFNGALCRGLLAARFDEPEQTEEGPGLRHFIHALPAEKRSSV
jgi:metal-sulfur cluster biosynthetic enzyme